MPHRPPPRRRSPAIAAAIGLLLAGAHGAAFPDTEPDEGIAERRPAIHALSGARLITAPGVVLAKGNVIIRDGRIVAVGADVPIPPEARVWPLDGRTLCAGFIELDLSVDLPPAPLPAPERVGLGWNPGIQPEREPLAALPLDEARARSLRAQGFALAVAAPSNGVLAGMGKLIALGVADGDRRGVVVDNEPVALFASLEHNAAEAGSPPSARVYPVSRMGAVALLRQTLYDARWYGAAWDAWRADPARAPRPEHNLSLEALAPVLAGELPIAFRCRDALELLALGRVAAEFGVRAWYLGSGEEYRWLSEVARLAPRAAVPVNFPAPPRVERHDDATRVTLETLEAWARAPENLLRLQSAEVAPALTTRGLAKLEEFPERARSMIARGLPFADLIAALTTRPAGILGRERELGTIAAGKQAHLVEFDGEPFAPGSRVLATWIDGKRFAVEPEPPADLRGEWEITTDVAGGTESLRVRVHGSRRAQRIEPVVGGRDEFLELTVAGDDVTMRAEGSLVGANDYVTLSGRVDRDRQRIDGVSRSMDGTRGSFRARRMAPAETELADGGDEYRAAVALWKGSAAEPLPRPFGACGRIEPPHEPASLVVRGATVWTCGPRGVLEDCDLHVASGVILAVGPDLSVPPGTEEIDASGQHVTAGLIDPHSHTAIIGGVNEGSQAVTAEVRIGDVIAAGDVNIYRELAGGLTTALLLHGSANPIGGQCAIVKLRWGEGPEQLQFAAAPPTIKFALGENVKQSNAGDLFTTRYPQTRMGVEQIIRDRFLAARGYRDARLAAEATGAPHRRDLELDALLEILDGTRSIHCHSYRQDEILALIRLAEEMSFRVGTFQHVLEGYKVAPEIARHGAGASSFSDWWAYKFEVYDAIPHNGALLHEAGVLTTFNSDSNEMARRLNLEAAKAVKYGGVPREQAIQFVTLNAARQLRVDDRIGSLEEGKDADFVIWSGDPLSTYSRCLETWIDGKRMFSRVEDARLRERDRLRKNELIRRLFATEHEAVRRRDASARDESEPPSGSPRVEEPK